MSDIEREINFVRSRCANALKQFVETRDVDWLDQANSWFDLLKDLRREQQQEAV